MAGNAHAGRQNVKTDSVKIEADAPPVSVPSSKTFTNTSAEDVKANVPDVKFYGDPDAWKLIVKAYSQKEGWMHSTKALEVDRVGVVIQTLSQQRNPDGTYGLCQATVFLPGVRIFEETIGKETRRSLRHV